MPSRATAPAVSACAAWVWLQSSAAAFAQDSTAGFDDRDIFMARVVIVTLIVSIYTLPSIVGFSRRHPNRWVILAINLVFGGTGIGWLGSLIWACGALHRSATGSNGGESGLNMFVNGPQVVRIASDPTTAPLPPVNVDEIAEKLLRIKSLYTAGAITDEEHAAMRAAALKAV